MQSLERGLSVIRAFDAEHCEAGLSEVARATGLTRAAARRFLLTLVELGYVHLDGGRFSLRPRVLELGFAYSVHASRASVAELRARFLPPARKAAAAIDAELRESGLRATGGSAPALSRG